jgi:hypothetical protein
LIAMTSSLQGLQQAFRVTDTPWYFWFLTHFTMGAVYKHVFFWIFHCSYPSKVKVLSYPVFPDFQKSIAFWKAPRLLSFVLLVRSTCTWRWIWSVRAMILTGENRSSKRKSCSTVTLTTTKLTSIRLGSNCDLRCERLATVRLNHSKQGCWRLKLIWRMYEYTDWARTDQ